MSEETQERIEKLNEQLMEELAEWEKLGVDPNQAILFNPAKNDIWLQSLTHFLCEKGVIEEDEFIIYFKERMLRDFIHIRTTEVEPAIARSKIHIPSDGMPNMDVPKGKRRFH